MIGTLWAALHMHSYVLSILFCVAQVCWRCPLCQLDMIMSCHSHTAAGELMRTT